MLQRTRLAMAGRPRKRAVELAGALALTLVAISAIVAGLYNP